MSIARKHFEKVSAAQAAETAKDKGETVISGNAADTMLARLRGHEVILKNIKSTRAKIIKKREFLPEYEGYIDGIISSGTGLQDNVVTTIMVWRFDISDLVGGLEIAAYVLEHDLKLPERFSRNAATMVLEVIADLCEATKPEGDQAKNFIDALGEAFELTDGMDMPDEVRAKSYKQLGFLQEADHPQAALDSLNAAFEFDPKSGVKTKIGQLEKLLKPADPPKDTKPAPASDLKTKETKTPGTKAKNTTPKKTTPKPTETIPSPKRR